MLLFPKIIVLTIISKFILDFLKCSGVSKDKSSWFGSHGHVQESGHHGNNGFSVSRTMESKRYESKMKQKNPTELLAIPFAYIYYRNGLEMTKMP